MTIKGHGTDAAEGVPALMRIIESAQAVAHSANRIISLHLSQPSGEHHF